MRLGRTGPGRPAEGAARSRASAARPATGRFYARWIELPGPGGSPSTAARRLQSSWLRELDRVGRLVAAGPTREPPGHLLILRAADRREAERALRSDPFRPDTEAPVRLWEWSPETAGAGVNLPPAPGRGAGRLTQLYRISVFVRDQRAARDWYREALGFEVREEDPSSDLVELSLGPGTAGLVLVCPQPAWGERHYEEAAARVGQGTGIAFRTDSVEALALRLRHAGARLTQPPRAEPWGGRSIRFADPDGNEFLAVDAGPGRPEPIPRTVRRRHRRREESGGSEPL